MCNRLLSISILNKKIYCLRKRKIEIHLDLHWAIVEHGIESFLSSTLNEDRFSLLSGKSINNLPPQYCRHRNVDNFSAFDSNLSANGIENKKTSWKPIESENVLSVRVHTKHKMRAP